MPKRPLTNRSGEVRSLTKADIASMQPAEAILPVALADAMAKRKPGQRGPQRTPTKVQVTLRLDREAVEQFRASGPGWQSRMGDAIVAAARRVPAKARRTS